MGYTGLAGEAKLAMGPGGLSNYLHPSTLVTHWVLYTQIMH